jgi:hypothetical protein
VGSCAIGRGRDMFGMRTNNSWRTWILNDIPANSRCVEVGVWKGDFSAQIMSTAKPRELHLVDPWHFRPSYPNRWYGGAKAASQSDMDSIHAEVVKRFQGEKAVQIHRMTSLEAAMQFPDECLDWVYIDGDHSYEAVKADLVSWIPKVRSGMFLAGDDYDWLDESGAPSVQRAVEEVLSELRLGRAEVEGGQYRIRVPSRAP